jgi:hydroxymethylpyrimidine pyrophosphatase-like HAD family hydrolase/adenine/guanine phosphoribosyltransferase-like PRPP-binding protein
VSTASYQRVRNIEGESERRFYERYAWCLNPLQPLGRLFRLLNDELEWYPALETEWQRKEARINLYLLTCAIDCTVSDYLGPRLPSFRKFGARWPRARLALEVADKAALAAHRLGSGLLDGAVWSWQREWAGCVELACAIVLNELVAQSPQVARLASMSRKLAGRKLPEKLRKAPMQLVSGFRAQDLTHHDAIALADAFDRSHSSGGTLAIVGARTAGGYFAPLIHARLQQLGWKSAWMAVRPKSGLGHWEKKSLLAMTGQAAKVLIVDDHPDTGETIRLMIDLLAECGVGRERIAVVVPSHEAQSDHGALTGGCTDVELVTLAAQDSYKHELLAGERLRPLIEQLVRGEGEFSEDRSGKDRCGKERSGERHSGGLQDAVVIDDEATKALNRELEAHLSDDFQVHMKRVYALRTPEGKIHRVLAKSVGWGFLGYHAYLAGSRLHEFVPKVYGLRDGMLFSEWIEEQASAVQSEEEVAERVAAYAAARVRLLSLADDPAVAQMKPSVGGNYTLAKVLRGVYPPQLRWLKMSALWSALQAYATRQPAFIDGNLGGEEWLSDGKKPLKIDYEHHGFGNPAPNVVDGAYDLALAALQLNLSPQAQRYLLKEYIRLTGDQNAGERMVLHALSCGHLAVGWARFHAMRARSDEAAKQLEAEHIEACNFLTYTLAEFCGEQFAERMPEAGGATSGSHGKPGTDEAAMGAEWSRDLFFMDLDGVFDRSSFYFPHTTGKGMAALAALRRHGYSVVLNTGRPVAHVRQYCHSYGMAGGIAEYGCVFVDRIAGNERVLIDAESREQLARLRTSLKEKPGVFLDPTYEVAIRGYGLENGSAVGLPETLVREALREFPRLTFISSPVDTYIMPAGTGKASATRKVMELKTAAQERSGAIGDTEHDLPMLGEVAKAYLPANLSREVRREARQRGYSVLSAPFQSGLLQAVEDLTGERQSGRASAVEARDGHAGKEHILKTLLSVSDRGAARQWLGALRRKRL